MLDINFNFLVFRCTVKPKYAVHSYLSVSMGGFRFTSVYESMEPRIVFMCCTEKEAPFCLYIYQVYNQCNI